ncbi:MAG: filamentous hemagglutinin N-terminal domain-containing protein, partial [Microcoleus sp.]|uniref:two-partner secretion domain-containing protein n=1 Tax=Microcoleus sp. TaxID=44472 RepID=UPI003C78A197
MGQSIAPANDGTGTTVNPQANRIDIGGGKQSGDGANLFHSFQRFGLNKNQIANFIANPNIQNILGRIVGGDVSIINGLIQVSGGNANLFLINPAGIIFGTTAQLNVPASFTATTANSIGFGNNSLSAIGFNNYLALTGMPTSFGFSAITPASIVNRGNLAVKQGGNLTLLGGTVTNTGQVSVEGGQIYIVTVPDKSSVRISQPGYLLSIEVSSEALNSQSNTANADSEKSTATLPEMLTGGGGQVNASDVAVSSDGSVKLTNSNPPKSSQNNLGTNNSGAVRLSQLQNNMPPQPTNTGNNTPSNTNTAIAPQPNTGNNTPSNTNTATAPQPNTGNLTAPPNTNGGTAPQPNAGNNTPPNINGGTAPQPNAGNLNTRPNDNN